IKLKTKSSLRRTSMKGFRATLVRKRRIRLADGNWKTRTARNCGFTPRFTQKFRPKAVLRTQDPTTPVREHSLPAGVFRFTTIKERRSDRDGRLSSTQSCSNVRHFLYS